LKREDFLN